MTKKEMETAKVRHAVRMAKIRQKGELLQMKQEEKELEREYRPKKKMSTSKAGLWYMMIMCTVIQIFSLIAMWHFADLSPLTTLIGATVGEVFAYWAYTLKASKENCAGGITYDLAFGGKETISEEDAEG